MYIGYAGANEACHIIASNNEYSLVSLPERRMGYILNESLNGVYEKIYGYAFVKAGTILYNDKKMTAYYDHNEPEMDVARLSKVSFLNVV